MPVSPGATSMQALGFLFSPSGRLRPRDFAFGAVVVYAAGAASQLLTVPDVLMRGGLWPFAAVQAVLTWVWFNLHAKRLRDADRGPGLAAGASLLYALSVVLLLILAAAFFKTTGGAITDASAASALGLILLLSIVVALADSANYDFGWFIVVILMVLAFLPAIVAIAVTIFAATRPTIEEPKA
jgi:uncharacterized membrane protein YhaH (DUF805 family)